MFPTNAAFVVITLLAVMGLVCSRVVEGNNDLLRQTSTLLANLVIVGRYFGWIGLIAGVAYVYTWLSSSDRSDGQMLGYFGFVYFFALLMVLAGVIVVPIRRRCPHCGKWDEQHEIGAGVIQRSKGERKVTVTRRNRSGEIIDQHEEMQAINARFVVRQYQCRHCEHQWEVIDKQEATGGWEG